MAMKIQLMVFWDMTSCSDVNFTLKMKTIWPFKTLVSYHITTVPKIRRPWFESQHWHFLHTEKRVHQN